MGKRTFFSMTGSEGGGFVIGANHYRIRILKARFGIRTCGRGRFSATLVRNDMGIASGSRPSRSIILRPGGAIDLGGKGLAIAPVASFGPCD